MGIGRKRDADQIVAHLQYLSANPPSGVPHWWPQFVYHCTDIRNAVGILESGQVLCRKMAKATGSMVVDIASSMVIRNTRESDLTYARFYFRPKTPTQYDNEGFRPPHTRDWDAHCAIPIYFLLDAAAVLTREDTMFTDGNLGSNPPKLSTALEFCQLPFDRIYHSRAVSQAEKRQITYHRNAEVIVPKCLPIDPSVLRYVWCRSPAEYQTLLNLLSEDTHRIWVSRIGEGPRLNLFYGYWTYIKEIEMNEQETKISFNPNTRTPGPFRISVEILEHETGIVYRWGREEYYANDEERDPTRYRVCCYLDGELALRAEYTSEHDVPF